MQVFPRPGIRQICRIPGGPERVNVMYLQREYSLFGCIYRHIDDCNVFSSCMDVFEAHVGDIGLF